MALTDVILLSSSPPQPPVKHNGVIQDELPSPEMLSITRLSRMSSGSRIQQIPERLNSSLSKVSAPIDSPWFAGLEPQPDPKDNASEDVPARKQPRKSSKGQKAEVIGDKSELLVSLKPSKGEAKKCSTGRKGAVTTTKKATKTSRIKAKDCETQSKLPSNRVTKVSNVIRPERSKFAEDLFSPCSNEPRIHENQTSPDRLQSNGATRRRSSWTPVKETNTSNFSTKPSVSSAVDVTKLQEDSALSMVNCTAFADMVDTFAFGNKSITLAKAKDVFDLGVNKRKPIQIIPSRASSSLAMPPPKPRSPRKKPLTITELATAAYRKPDDVGGDPIVNPAPLLQYMSVKAPDSIPEAKPSRRSSRSPSKQFGKSGKPKKGTKERPILLSPESALKQSAKQDFVFGTSSQLAREKSPTLLRDLHTAMRLSNGAHEFHASDESLNNVSSFGFTAKSLQSYATKRGLWSAASRGEAGEVLEVETLDLTDSPKKDRLQQGLESDAKKLNNTSHNHDLDVFASVEELGNVQAVISTGSNDFAPEKTQDPQKDFNIASAAATATTLPLIGRVNVKKGTKKTGKSADSKPDFESYSTARLSKAIASYGFKPIKSRETMIYLLHRCWDDSKKLVNQALSDSARVVAMNNSSEPAKITKRTSESNSSRSPRQTEPRPQPAPIILQQTPERQKKRYVDLDEISDSECSLLTPSPPRNLSQRLGSRPLLLLEATTTTTMSSPHAGAKKGLTSSSSSFKPPPPAEPSNDDDYDDAVARSPLLLLHRHISLAVRDAPRSEDPARPSWYEKMLLYDPIVIEDLTVWLNTGALGRAGWDGEVAPREVKGWCEAKSVCCFWKDTPRNRKRRRL